MDSKMKEFVKSEHKYELTSFKLKVARPLTPKHKLPEPIEKYIPEHDLCYWVCYSWEDVQKDKYLKEAYKSMLWNFRYSTNSFDDSKGMTRVWFFMHTTFNKGLNPTNLYYPVGMLGITEKPEHNMGYPSYSIAWMHPYLRGHGFMKILLAHLMCQKFHVSEPPVTQSMNFCLSKVTSLLDPEQLSTAREWAKEYMEKRHNINLKGVSVKEFEAMAGLFHVVPDDKIDQDLVDRMLTMFRDPEAMEELKQWLSGQGDIDQNQMLQDMNRIANMKHLQYGVDTYGKQAK